MATARPSGLPTHLVSQGRPERARPRISAPGGGEPRPSRLTGSTGDRVRRSSDGNEPVSVGCGRGGPGGGRAGVARAAGAAPVTGRAGSRTLAPPHDHEGDDGDGDEQEEEPGDDPEGGRTGLGRLARGGGDLHRVAGPEPGEVTQLCAGVEGGAGEDLLEVLDLPGRDVRPNMSFTATVTVGVIRTLPVFVMVKRAVASLGPVIGASQAWPPLDTLTSLTVSSGLSGPATRTYIRAPTACLMSTLRSPDPSMRLRIQSDDATDVITGLGIERHGDGDRDVSPGSGLCGEGPRPAAGSRCPGRPARAARQSPRPAAGG